jgi:putative Mg2+ transporter-C (MgtC) family protein
MNGNEASVWEIVTAEFQDFGDWRRLVHVALRLFVAALLGGLLGYQRELTGKSAGLRTHMLVTLGAAFFVIVPQLENMPTGDISRVVQGLIAGIGFLGGGAILKVTTEKEIYGLTTAAGIWMAAAIGVAAGFGRLGTAILAAGMSFLILDLVYRVERMFLNPGKKA